MNKHTGHNYSDSKDPFVADSGIMYVATGERYLMEACRSARRCKQLMPEIPLALASDLPAPRELFACQIQIESPKGNFSDKMDPLLKSPFRRTVFLDTDTWLCEPVPELFSILERCDIAMAHAPMRFTAASDAPASFPECNSGVIAYNMNDRTRALFDLWDKLYQERLKSTGVVDDQPSLRDALWQSDISFAALPPEYNFRFIMPAFAGRGGIKILHGRHHDYPSLAKMMNRSRSPRVFLPRLREAVDRHFIILSLPGRLLGYWIGWDARMAGVIGKIVEGVRWRLSRM
jgi:hypothetical protein